jgi:hypothetical protein
VHNVKRDNGGSMRWNVSVGIGRGSYGWVLYRRGALTITLTITLISPPPPHVVISFCNDFCHILLQNIVFE